MIKNVHKLKLLAAAPTFFTDDSTHLGVTDTTRVKHVLLRQPGEIIYHLDGEPKKTQDQLEIKILPAALNVLIP